HTLSKKFTEMPEFSGIWTVSSSLRPSRRNRRFRLRLTRPIWMGWSLVLWLDPALGAVLIMLTLYPLYWISCRGGLAVVGVAVGRTTPGGLVILGACSPDTWVVSTIGPPLATFLMPFAMSLYFFAN